MCVLSLAHSSTPAHTRAHDLTHTSHTHAHLTRKQGNSATGAEKDATLVTGKRLRVPLFLNEGDVVEVDTRDGKYLKRISS